MPEKLSREIRKLEVRLEDFLTNEKEFVKGLKVYLEKIKELNNKVEELVSSDSRRVGEIMMLRLEAARAFNDAMEKEGGFGHEKSHLLESYGALILAIEEAFYQAMTT